MAVGHAGSPRRRVGGLLDALFGEAWDIERRRRRRWLLLLLACCVTAAAVLLVAGPGGRATRSGSTSGSSRVIVTSHRLPLDSNYTGLAVANGRLLLIDYGDYGAKTFPCRVATVDPESLGLSSVARGSCNNPALFGEHVMEVRQSARGGPLEVRVAIVDRHARAGYTLGPDLFSYDQCSDCWDKPIYGRHSLWIYAPFSSPDFKRRSGELFRISERTGRLLQHWRMPSVVRPLLAVDADGLWIAASIDTGSPDALYHVAPGMSHPQRVLTIGTRKHPDQDARYLVASHHTVWFETWMAYRGWISRLYRLNGTKVTADGVPLGGRTPCTDMGAGPASVLGNAAGIYCVQTGGWTSGLGVTSQEVLRIVPDGLDQRVVAKVTPPAGTYDSDAAADLGNSYYFLDSGSGNGGAGELFRVGPR